MQNLLIVLGVLFVSLFVIVPLVQKTAKPISAEQQQKYGKIFGILMIVLIVATSVKYCMGG